MRRRLVRAVEPRGLFGVAGRDSGVSYHTHGSGFGEVSTAASAGSCTRVRGAAPGPRAGRVHGGVGPRRAADAALRIGGRATGASSGPARSSLSAELRHATLNEDAHTGVRELFASDQARDEGPAFRQTVCNPGDAHACVLDYAPSAAVLRGTAFVGRERAGVAAGVGDARLSSPRVAHHIAKLRRELRLEHYERRRLLEPSPGAPTRARVLERLLYLLGVRQRRPHGRAVGIVADLLEPGVGAARVLFAKNFSSSRSDAPRTLVACSSCVSTCSWMAPNFSTELSCFNTSTERSAPSRNFSGTLGNG